MYTCTTPPDFSPHMAITEALPTVAPLKSRCLEKNVQSKIVRKITPDSPIPTYGITDMCNMKNTTGIEPTCILQSLLNH